MRRKGMLIGYWCESQKERGRQIILKWILER
jgi:hypothetical protein